VRSAGAAQAGSRPAPAPPGGLCQVGALRRIPCRPVERELRKYQIEGIERESAGTKPRLPGSLPLAAQLADPPADPPSTPSHRPGRRPSRISSGSPLQPAQAKPGQRPGPPLGRRPACGSSRWPASFRPLQMLGINEFGCQSDTLASNLIEQLAGGGPRKGLAADNLPWAPGALADQRQSARAPRGLPRGLTKPPADGAGDRLGPATNGRPRKAPLELGPGVAPLDPRGGAL